MNWATKQNSSTLLVGGPRTKELKAHYVCFGPIYRASFAKDQSAYSRVLQSNPCHGMLN